jgi:hypothetical protein
MTVAIDVLLLIAVPESAGRTSVDIGSNVIHYAIPSCLALATCRAAGSSAASCSAG